MSAVQPVAPEHSRFPFCLVWTSIPLITWLFPFVGHLGLASSEGIIFDFAGPYFVSEDDFAFGKPLRYLKLDPERVRSVAGRDKAETYDASIARGNAIYKERMHNLFCDNCHSHVAVCLNACAYGGSTSWNMVGLAALMFFRGTYVSPLAIVAHWAPCLLLVGVIVAVSMSTSA